MFPDGSIAPAPYTCIILCRVPNEWVGAGHLSGEKLEKLFEKMYGENWRAGNDDGSHYVVLSVEGKMLNSQEENPAADEKPGTNNDRRYWYFHVTDREEWIEVDASAF